MKAEYVKLSFKILFKQSLVSPPPSSFINNKMFSSRLECLDRLEYLSENYDHSVYDTREQSLTISVSFKGGRPKKITVQLLENLFIY